MSTQNLNEDYSFYNFLINNETDAPIEANFDETRQQPVLMNMELYQAFVVKFKIPLIGAPLLVFSDTDYFIGFSLGDANNTIIKVPVVFDPTFANNTSVIPPTNRYIYYYSSFMAMINNALFNLWNLALANPAYSGAGLPLNGFTESDYPYFTLDSTITTLIKLVTPYNNTKANPSPFVKPKLPVAEQQNYINLSMSSKLFYFFTGYNAKFYGPLGLGTPPDNQLNYTFLFNETQMFSSIIDLEKWNTSAGPPLNPPELDARTRVGLVGNYSSLHLWSQTTRILITTTMPLQSESIGIRDSNGANFTQVILAEFDVPTEKDSYARDNLYYYPYQYRYQNFSSNGVLRKMNLRVYFQTRDLQIYPLYIPTSFEMSLLMGFKRRKARQLLDYGNSKGNIYR